MSKEPSTIKELLPDGWLPTLAKICNSDDAYISKIVNREKFTSKHWEAIAAMAKEVDSKAYNERINFLKKQITDNAKAKTAAKSKTSKVAA